MEPAPLFEDIARGPGGGAAYWVDAADGLRLRVGHWPRGDRGTVLMFPGRTEYVEKYGDSAREFAARGYGLIAVDWRGQGLADRMLGDRLGGHVMRFTDYQMDVAATVAAARRLDLPRPWHLVAHSMGGCIGLRALVEGLDVASVAFSAPMWGIALKPALRPLAWSLSWAAVRTGLDHRYAPGTSSASYPNTAPFGENMLTSDAEMYAWMAEQVDCHPELTLGGPSMRWLGEALRETRELSLLASPDLPCLCILGSEEKIVDAQRIRERMAVWPGSRLELVDGGRHECMMETPARRAAVFAMMADHFDAHSAASAA
ncbi:alpha/beta hydrolase [Rhodobacteraceae bacterium CCMM004]|nr:alpha/beta hydrolase [Rhodobacteraceae bacterium CCMM004]